MSSIQGPFFTAHGVDAHSAQKTPSISLLNLLKPNEIAELDGQQLKQLEIYDSNYSVLIEQRAHDIVIEMSERLLESLNNRPAHGIQLIILARLMYSLYIVEKYSEIYERLDTYSAITKAVGWDDSNFREDMELLLAQAAGGFPDEEDVKNLCKTAWEWISNQISKDAQFQQPADSAEQSPSEPHPELSGLITQAIHQPITEGGTQSLSGYQISSLSKSESANEWLSAQYLNLATNELFYEFITMLNRIEKSNYGRIIPFAKPDDSALQKKISITSPLSEIFIAFPEPMVQLIFQATGNEDFMRKLQEFNRLYGAYNGAYKQDLAQLVNEIYFFLLKGTFKKTEKNLLDHLTAYVLLKRFWINLQGLSLRLEQNPDDEFTVLDFTAQYGECQRKLAFLEMKKHVYEILEAGNFLAKNTEGLMHNIPEDIGKTIEALKEPYKKDLEELELFFERELEKRIGQKQESQLWGSYQENYSKFIKEDKWVAAIYEGMIVRKQLSKKSHGYEHAKSYIDSALAAFSKKACYLDINDWLKFCYELSLPKCSFTSWLATAPQILPKTLGEQKDFIQSVPETLELFSAKYPGGSITPEEKKWLNIHLLMLCLRAQYIATRKSPDSLSSEAREMQQNYALALARGAYFSYKSIGEIAFDEENYFVHAQISKALGEIYMAKNNPVCALQHFYVAAEYLRLIGKLEYSVEAAHVYFRMAEIHVDQGDYHQACTLLSIIKNCCNPLPETFQTTIKKAEDQLLPLIKSQEKPKTVSNVFQESAQKRTFFEAQSTALPSVSPAPSLPQRPSAPLSRTSELFPSAPLPLPSQGSSEGRFASSRLSQTSSASLPQQRAPIPSSLPVPSSLPTLASNETVLKLDALPVVPHVSSSSGSARLSSFSVSSSKVLGQEQHSSSSPVFNTPNSIWCATHGIPQEKYLNIMIFEGYFDQFEKGIISDLSPIEDTMEVALIEAQEISSEVQMVAYLQIIKMFCLVGEFEKAHQYAQNLNSKDKWVYNEVSTAIMEWSMGGDPEFPKKALDDIYNNVLKKLNSVPSFNENASSFPSIGNDQALQLTQWLHESGLLEGCPSIITNESLFQTFLGRELALNTGLEQIISSNQKALEETRRLYTSPNKGLPLMLILLQRIYIESRFTGDMESIEKHIQEYDRIRQKLAREDVPSVDYLRQCCADYAAFYLSKHGLVTIFSEGEEKFQDMFNVIIEVLKALPKEKKPVSTGKIKETITREPTLSEKLNKDLINIVALLADPKYAPQDVIKLYEYTARYSNLCERLDWTSILNLGGWILPVLYRLDHEAKPLMILMQLAQAAKQMEKPEQLEIYIQAYLTVAKEKYEMSLEGCQKNEKNLRQGKWSEVFVQETAPDAIASLNLSYIISPYPLAPILPSDPAATKVDESENKPLKTVSSIARMTKPSPLEICWECSMGNNTAIDSNQMCDYLQAFEEIQKMHPLRGEDRSSYIQPSTEIKARMEESEFRYKQIIFRNGEALLKQIPPDQPWWKAMIYMCQLQLNPEEAALYQEPLLALLKKLNKEKIEGLEDLITEALWSESPENQKEKFAECYRRVMEFSEDKFLQQLLRWEDLQKAKTLNVQLPAELFDQEQRCVEEILTHHFSQHCLFLKEQQWKKLLKLGLSTVAILEQSNLQAQTRANIYAQLATIALHYKGTPSLTSLEQMDEWVGKCYGLCEANTLFEFQRLGVCESSMPMQEFLTKMPQTMEAFVRSLKPENPIKSSEAFSDLSLFVRVLCLKATLHSLKAEKIAQIPKKTAEAENQHRYATKLSFLALFLYFTQNVRNTLETTINPHICSFIFYSLEDVIKRDPKGDQFLMSHCSSIVGGCWRALMTSEEDYDPDLLYSIIHPQVDNAAPAKKLKIDASVSESVIM